VSNLQAEAEDEPDVLIPDRQARVEFGGITDMTLRRWTKDSKLDFPPPIKIRGRNFRSRQQLERFKKRMLAQAIRERAPIR